MVLIFWWMLVIWAVAIGVYWLARHLLRGDRPDSVLVLPVAHSNRLTNLPAYMAALKQYRLLMNWTVGLLSLCLLTAIILTARPATVSVVTPVQQNRDIMLCLDASGSVLREDTTLLDRFGTLVAGFSGQRFGLTLFNSSAVTVVPLNDDYPIITQQLKTSATAFKAQSGATFTTLTNGTLAGYESGTSLASDGLVSCIQQMGTNAGHRSQSIVLGTDNEVNGTPVVSMNQAVALAKQRNIHIFVIDPGVSDPSLSGDHDQLGVVARETGGNYYELSDSGAVPSIISAINAQPAANFVGLPQLATNDNPKWFLFGAALLTLSTLVLIWRLEL